MPSSPSSILSIGTAVPSHSQDQMVFADAISSRLSLNEERGTKLKKIFRGTTIEKRHSVVADFKEDFRGLLFGSDYPEVKPGMSQRNEIYKEEAPKLAKEAAIKALEEWGGSPGEITHVISASCTGMIAPGIECLLIDELGLSPTVSRVGINFMGCFGAFIGLENARALAQDPKARILLVCTELCSLHFQADTDTETFVGNSLFADGAAAVVVGQEEGLWKIVKKESLVIPDTRNEMTWEASDLGYLMRLSAEIPFAIYQQIEAFVKRLAGEIPFDQIDWPVHPGGKAILYAVRKACGLDPSQLESSWEVFRKYGNMSSATFLFILDALRRKEQLQKHAIGIGFGPGLSLEGILLER